MRNPLAIQIEHEVAPLLEVHGVDLVALEWLEGAGRGLLRLTVDRHGGDPRVQDPTLGVPIDVLARITRDVSSAVDAMEERGELRIELPYQLEVTSPGPERPVQRRADFERFKGLRVRIETGSGAPGAVGVAGRVTVKGVIDAVQDGPEGTFTVIVLTAGRPTRVESGAISRARLEAIAPPKKSEKPGKGPSRRQERLAKREKARAVNEQHNRSQSEGSADADGRGAAVEGDVRVPSEGAGAPPGAER
jgi:ribosome maturation factor RimP